MKFRLTNPAKVASFMSATNPLRFRAPKTEKSTFSPLTNFDDIHYEYKTLTNEKNTGHS